ncbi:hypothetical protein HUO13_09695 [Saccharopolyspora erythraea]|uniref:hypothetical protein n=1 Tax=Saccharopolyspora erythraea TaxID=1836 RepID=UPI001BAB751F|nr:hypothetical protein [Saccharopolyspora erythraea]QUH01059.1 hypothetical protein HUO13_09695 [Saccharopolyspora erythraea]
MNAQPHLIARVRPELARTERELSCHLFPLPADGTLPASLRAYCGFDIVPGQAEQLDGPAGMPCMPCLLQAALAS